MLVGESVTWFCRLEKLSAGVSVTLDHEIKSGLCCTTKFVEGMSQERARLLLEDEMFKFGAGAT